MNNSSSETPCHEANADDTVSSSERISDEIFYALFDEAVDHFAQSNLRFRWPIGASEQADQTSNITPELSIEEEL